MPLTTPFLKIYICVIAALLGACMGSFLNCFAWRIVHKEPVWKGRSHCDACGHVLGVRDLFPVFSYLFSHGTCRYCGGKLSARYLWSEIVSALVFVSVVLRFGLTAETAQFLLLACALLACSFADLEDYLIPDRFILFAIAVRLVFILLSGDILHNLWLSFLGGISVSGAILVIVLIMEKILKKEAMGGGDLKLMFVIGLYLGWQKNFLCLMFACVAGILFYFLQSSSKRSPEKLFPWGPSIAIGAWAAALFGDAILQWYLGLFRV